jgi:membrane-bound ClpP family serine protease
LSKFIGRIGKTLTLLTPGGLMMVDGERFHCESEGVIIDSGEDVRIVSVKGNRLVVRHDPGAANTISESDRNLSEAEKPPLDFDLPQG